MSTAKKLYEITEEPLSLDDVARRVTRPDCGAVTTFAGTVRGETATDAGQRETDFLIYEAYTEMAERTLAEIGEPSVVIAVATPHRGDGCFEACRYAIERLKAVVPIWKQENWSDGSLWIEGPTGERVTG